MNESKLMIDPVVSNGSASHALGDSAPLAPASPRTPPLSAREHKGDTKRVHGSPKSPLRSVDKFDEEGGGLWRKFRELFVHMPLAQKGLMVAKVKGMGKTPFATAESLTVGSRILFFDQPKEKWPSYHKQATLLKQIEKFYGREERGEVIEKEVMVHCQTSQNARLVREYAEESVIYNTKRRDEVFLPFLIKNADDWTQFYIYPWLSQNSSAFKFPGFKRFVVAVCMFGAGFRGQCQNNNEFTLIKHFIPFFPEQCIVNVSFEEDLTRNYENYVFSQLKSLSAYVQAHTKDDQPKELFCHMPYYDYILFCIELFSRGRMSFAALDQSIAIILQKRDIYSREIEKICKVHDVTVYIGSPFDSIFEGLESELQESPAEDGDGRFAQAFLQRLGISCKGIDLKASSIKAAEAENEKRLVQKCLTALCTNESSNAAQRVWADFIKSNNKKEVTTLEELFKMANAAMVAISTTGMEDYETLVWELLTEKQIQVSYADFSRNAKYPAVVNFTVLDPGIIYTRTNGGNLFYQERHSQSQKSLMKRWPLISQLAAQQELSVDKVKEMLSTVEKDAKADGSPKLLASSSPSFGPKPF